MRTSVMQTGRGSLFVAKCESGKEPAGISIRASIETLYRKLSRRKKRIWQGWILVSERLPPVAALVTEGAFSLIELIVQEWG